MDNFRNVDKYEIVNADNDLTMTQLLCTLQQCYAERTRDNAAAHQSYVEQIPPVREEVDRLAAILDQQKTGLWIETTGSPYQVYLRKKINNEIYRSFYYKPTTVQEILRSIEYYTSHTSL